MLNVQIYFEEKNGTLITSPIIIAGENSNVNEDELIYENVFEEKIDVKIGQLTNGRSFDYVLKSKDIFENVSQSATHMVFEETIILPNGWSASLVNNEVFLNNPSGINAKYEKPVCYDSPSTNSGNNGNETASEEYKGFHEPSYNISQTGNTLILKTLVDINWLKSENRSYPLLIDPNFYCYNATDGTGYITDQHYDGSLQSVWNHSLSWTSNGTEFWVGFYDWSPDDDYAGWTRIDISSLPTSIVVSDCDFVHKLKNMSYMQSLYILANSDG